MDLIPKVIRIEPASACNLRCSHCPTGTVKMKRGILDWNDFLIILQQIKKYSQYVKVLVLYHGGEPFLNNNFCKMASLLREVCPEAKIQINTNGMLLTEDIAYEIINIPLDLIEFSLDGQNPIENDFIRHNCNFKQVVENINLLIKLKEELSTPKPIIYIDSVQFIKPVSIEPPNIRNATVPDYLLSAFNKGIQEFRASYAMKWPDMVVNHELYDVFIDPYDNDNDECDHVLNTMTIRCDGTVVPCCYDITSKMVMGNALTTDIAEIWFNEKYADLRENIKKKNYNAFCKNCNTLNRRAYLIPKKIKISDL